jgi:CRISPR-associated exonuclease Cas4
MIAEPQLLPLRVHDLKQWDYCRRIVFYNHVMPVEKRSTYKMRHGRAAEDAIDRLEKRRKLTEFGLGEGNRLFHLWCNSDELGLSGRLDLLIDSPAGLFPVDFKASERQVHDNHITQLCGYALLVEAKFLRCVERGFIFLIPCEEIVPIELTTERKAACRDMLAEIRASVNTEIIPDPTDVRTRCDECEYRNYCSDIF